MNHIKVNLPTNQDEFNDGVGEGCWVEVNDEVFTLYNEDYVGGIFTGTLLNHSYYYPDLIYGSEIKFTMRGTNKSVAYIEGFLEKYEVISEEEKDALIQRVAYLNTYGIISKRAHETKSIGFLFKDFPRDDSDSGWVFTSGYETEEEQANSDAFIVLTLREIIDIDSRLQDLIYQEPRCAFCLNDENEFIEVDDFDWDTYEGN